MSDPAKQPFCLYRFIFQAVDPVHVGVGGYRLGRVDLPIAREPGTNLPKIPGTGISGAARHYAALLAGRLGCAGQGGAGEQKDNGRGHCGELDKCPICYSFGTLRLRADGVETAAVAGRVRIFDAQLLLFPVATFRGPVWVTSPQTLRDFGWRNAPSPKEGKVLVTGELEQSLKKKPLNLGWLMVEVDAGEFHLPSTGSSGGDEVVAGLLGGLPDFVKQRLVIISDELFSTVVNSNLEVRTGVSINPETGAAEERALFTYEALPRASFLYLDVIEEKRVPGKEGVGKNSPFPWPKSGSEEAARAVVACEAWKSPLDVVVAGFKYFEYLGVGGMATRGFGRLKLVPYEGVGQQ